jgi:hypothetical protein
VKRILHHQDNKHHQDRINLSSHLFLLVQVTLSGEPDEITLFNIIFIINIKLVTSFTDEEDLFTATFSYLASVVLNKLFYQTRQASKQKYKSFKFRYHCLHTNQDAMAKSVGLLHRTSLHYEKVTHTFLCVLVLGTQVNMMFVMLL